MVGPLKLLKILHCRSNCSSTNNVLKKEKVSLHETNGMKNSLNDNVPSNPVKVEVLNYNEDLCRVCLHKGSILIYGNNSQDLSNALRTFAAIDISEDDVFPKYICQSCYTLLQSAILFRKTAQESDKVLKQANTNKCESFPEIDIHFEYEFEPDDKVKTEVKETIKPIELSCKRCDINFESFKGYEEHRLSDDHNNKKVTCPVCNKLYKYDYLKKHMDLHTGKAEYMCDICGKLFICQNHFSRHRLTHFYDLPIKCELCPYRGRFPESLKMHMRRHTGEKPYQCTQCSSKFLNKSNLNKHMLTHKTERDFKCVNNNCGKEFHTKRQLELHVRVVHAGVLDYKCRYCEKAFGYRRHMMKHERKVHKRAKVPYGIMPLYLQVDNMKNQSKDIAPET